MRKKFNLIIPWGNSPWMKKILRLMKLTFALILLAAIQTFAIDSYSQNTMLTLNMKNSSVKDVLQQIENQSEFYFLYSSKVIDVNRKVDVQAENNRIDKILNNLFEGTDVLYAVEGRQIVLTTSEISGRSSSSSTAQQRRTISGKVTSSNGEPMPGVTVVVRGTSAGTITDPDGFYSITVPEQGNTLVFSFIGMETKTIEVGNQSRIDVVMDATTIGLEEVVAIGYGTIKKSDVTGSVVSVAGAELTARPVNNALEALQGRAAGVDITASQRPGTLGSINIRGVRSLTASNEPLYVVDGVPIMTERQTDTERNNDVKKSSGIETLNPQDIESIDILKDASATAIYGSRGANGVVLITTKRGTDGKISLKYSGTVTSESMVWRSRYMNVEEYIDFIRWAAYNKNPTALSPGDQPSLANDSKIELFTADPTAWANIQKGWAGGNWDVSKLETYDWMSEVTQPNITQEHTVSASGGNKAFKAYASIGYLDNKGTTKGQEYQRYTMKTSVDVTPKEWLHVGATMNASWSYQDYGQANIGGSMTGFGNNLIETAARIYPYALPYDVNGVKIAYPGGQSRVATVINEWEYSTNQRETMRVLGALFAEVKLFDGLRYRVNFGPDLRFYRNGIYNDGKSVIRGGSSYANYSGNKNFSWTIDNLLYYDKTFGLHNVGATLLQTASKYTFESYNMAAQGIPISSMQWYAMGSVSALDSWGTGLSERQLASYMARVNYGFNNKYLLTLSGRWDGASQLAEGNKWAFFPSAALGWRIEQEEFMKDVEWINQLKLRLGYGATGNAAVNPYTTKGEINLVQQPFGSAIVNGYTTTNSLSNKELGWERTTQYNLGLDFSVLKGRISGVVDVYTSHTTDLLMTMALSTVSGYNSSLANIGETKNMGVDLSISTINVQTKDFVWESRINAAWQKDEIVSLMNGKEDMVDNVWFIGHPISVIYNYERLGLWQNTQEDLDEMAKFNANGHKFTPGMVKVKDQNDDHRITANYDRVILGNTLPRFTLGFNNDFKYKNWDLSIFITGRMKYLRNVSQALTGMYGDQRMLDYWTPNNTDAEYQKPFRDEAGGDSYADTYFRDDSYLKIRSISLGYTLPKSLVSRLGIGSLKVYAQTRDAGLLWSSNKFLDPEYGGLYFNRGLVFGVNVEF
jgi:TonB-linked SusC/RagA family outer membrane protein